MGRKAQRGGAKKGRGHAEKNQRMGVDDPFDATFPQGPSAKVQEQADLQFGESEIAIQLREMSITEAIHSLDFNDHVVVHDQIHDVGVGNA